jgi:hypothetical protein
VLEELQAVPDGLFETGDAGFRALATAYVILRFSKDGKPFDVRDEFLAVVLGHFEQDGPTAVIDHLSINVRSP